MSNFSETFAKYNWLIDGVYQIEKSDPVEGGPNGVSNRQAFQLTHRTRDLYNRLVGLKTLVEEIQGGDLETGYDSLLKLQNKLQAVENAINGDNGNALIETLQEALAFINDHKSEIESLVNTYIKKSSIADNLTTSDNRYVLSANRGKELKDLHDALTVTVQGKETPVGAQQKADSALTVANAYTDKRIYYDYIVDSNQKLVGLHNNPLATRVLIKAGTWQANALIEIDRNCQMIVGEPGSKIMVTTSLPGSESTPVSALYNRYGKVKLVNVTGVVRGPSNSAYLTVFKGFTGMENCVAITDQTFSGNNTGITAGFYDCSNLTSCRAQCTVNSQNTVSAKYAYGFWLCKNCNQCVASVIGKTIESATENGVSAYGFYKCDVLTGCYATAAGEHGNPSHAAGFSYCNYLTGCKGLAEGSGSGKRLTFSYCEFVCNCIGEVHGYIVGFDSISFFQCMNVTLCRGYPATSDMYAFKNCYYVSYCVAGGMGFEESYAGSKEGYSAADTAEGGYNRSIG